MVCILCGKYGILVEGTRYCPLCHTKILLNFYAYKVPIPQSLCVELNHKPSYQKLPSFCYYTGVKCQKACSMCFLEGRM